MQVTVIGAGLAGCEAAWQLAQRGIAVTLHEMKPEKTTPAHHTADFAELCCSNSLRSDQIENAVGLLKEELRRLDSLILACADATRVEAGGALAVDRYGFSKLVTVKIRSHPNITVVPGEVTAIPEGNVIIASGPLTSDALAAAIAEKIGDGHTLNFFDAAAPLVTFESVDMDSAFFASRYDKGGDDYINCPMNKEEYTAFYRELINAESAPLHGFDKAPNVYEGCMPIEVLAKRGEDSIRFGPLKPVGLRDPRTGHRPWAAVQLRRENAAATLFNIVGFQTNLKFSEQKRVFSMILGLENAEFMRYGVMHRNTFINSPKMLNRNLSLKADKNIFIAGQLSGVEGYMESAASGIIAGINAAAEITGEKPLVLPETTMTGALLSYITNPLTENFQPMGANFGIIPPLEAHIRDKRERYAALAARALGILADNIKTEEM